MSALFQKLILHVFIIKLLVYNQLSIEKFNYVIHRYHLNTMYHAQATIVTPKMNHLNLHPPK
jgi:hypothetical protein